MFFVSPPKYVYTDGKMIIGVAYKCYPKSSSTNDALGLELRTP